jgi:hypothetical protein
VVTPSSLTRSGLRTGLYHVKGTSSDCPLLRISLVGPWTMESYRVGYVAWFPRGLKLQLKSERRREGPHVEIWLDPRSPDDQ